MPLYKGTTLINPRRGSSRVVAVYRGTAKLFGLGATSGGGEGGGSSTPIWNGAVVEDSSFSFNNNGSTSAFGVDWLNTISTSEAALYEMSFASATGNAAGSVTYGGMTAGTWYGLSSARSFSFSATQGATDKNAFISVTIRKIGTTTPTYAGTLNFYLAGNG